MSGETAQKPNEKPHDTPDGKAEETTAGKPAGARREQARHPLRYRIVGVLIGLAIGLIGVGATLVNGVQGVEATGLVGNRGAFTVEYCYESSGRMWPDYRCRGTFDPLSEDYAARTVTVENADHYPKGEQLDVVESSMGSKGYFRETGVWATLGSLLWLCFGLAFLPWGFFTTRRWVKGHVK